LPSISMKRKWLTKRSKCDAFLFGLKPVDHPLCVCQCGTGAYSAKLLNGTRQRFSGFSQPR
jgi:hypothetical protein